MYAIALVVPSTFMWVLLYGWMRKINANRSPEFANRLVTLFHGCLISVCGSSQCYAREWVFYIYNEPSTTIQTAILLCSLGYFLFDLAWCLYYQSETALMIAHHIYSCFAISRLIIKGYSGNQACCALGLMEFTNPLLQIRWFVRALGYQKTRLFKIVEWGFLTIFISMRLFLGTVVCFEILMGKEDLEFKILAVAIYLVSWAFMVNMYMYVRKKYTPNEHTVRIQQNPVSNQGAPDTTTNST